MNKLYQKILLIPFVFNVFSLQQFASDGNPKVTLEKFKSTTRFIENKGQVTDQYHKQRTDVKFTATVNQTGAIMAFTEKGFSYQIHQWEEYEIEDTFGILEPDEKKRFKINYNRIDIEFIGGNRDVKIRGVSPYNYMEQYINVTGEYKDIKSYHGIIYENLYPGIDLMFYEKNNEIKYDFIVHPGADPSMIKMKFTNYPVFLQDNNTLVIKATLGEIKEDSLVAYDADNTKELVDVKYELNHNILTFKISDYPKNKTLVIDPPVRIWGKYFGGIGNDNLYNIKYHSYNGINYIFIIGESTSSNLPVTIGAFQGSFGGNVDGYLMNIDKDGNIIHCTYLGTNAYDTFDVLDCKDSLLIVGGRTEANGLGTNGTHQQFALSGFLKVHLHLFDIRNYTRYWGTYIDPPGASGGNADRVYNVKFDNYGSIYVCGTSNSNKSSPIIYFANTGYVSYQNRSIDNNTNSHIKGYDGYLVSLRVQNGTGKWGTYLGMFKSDQAITGIAINDDKIYCYMRTTGNVTNSNSFDTLVTPGTYDNTYNGGTNDWAIVSFDSTGNKLWGTLLGGNGDENNTNFNNKIIYVTNNSYFSQDFILCAGTTNSTNLPAINSLQSSLSGNYDWYIKALSTDGVNLLSATYYGGTLNDRNFEIIYDPQLNILYSAGLTQSFDFNISNLSHQNFNSGGEDGIFCIFTLNPNSSLSYISSSYYGGSNNDNISSITYDDKGTIYIAGTSASSSGWSSNPNPISTLNSYLSGSTDGYVARFCTGLNPEVMVTSNITPNPICQYDTLAFSGTYTITNGTFQNLYWVGPSPQNSFNSNNLNDTIFNVDYNNAGAYHLVVFSSTNEVGCASERVTVNYTPMPSITASLNPACEYNDVTLSSNEPGHPTYQWSGPNGYTSNDELPLITNVTNPQHDGVYTVTVTTANNCSNSTQFYLYVVDSANMNLNLTPLPGDSICLGSFFDLSVTGGDVGSSYVWSNPTFPSQPDIYGLQANANTSYTVTVTNPVSCMGTATRTITVYALDAAQANVVINAYPNQICYGSGDSISVWVTGGTPFSFYTWSEPSLLGLDSGRVYYSTSQNLSVTVTNPELCAGDITTSIPIQVVNNVNLVAFSNAPICTGNNLSIQLITDGNAIIYLPDNTPYYGTSYIVSNAQPHHSGTYHIISTNSQGCKDSVDITVVVSNHAPVIYNSGPVCEGGTLQLFSGFGSSYQWTGPNGFTSNQQNPVITNVTPAHAGVYTVTVSGTGNCTGTGTTSVTVDGWYSGTHVISILTGNDPICDGEGVLLYTNLADNYLWSNGATTQSIWVENNGVSTVTNQTYTVTVTNISGCNQTNTPLYQTASANVTFMPPVNTQILGDKLVCLNDTLVLTHIPWNAQPPYNDLQPTYFTPNGNSFPIDTLLITPFTNSDQGYYILQATDPQTGCYGIDSILVSIIQFNSSISVNGTSCVGSSISLNVEPANQVTWITPQGNITANPLTLSNLTSSNQGIYIAQVVDTNNCYGEIQQSIVISQIEVSANSNSPVCKYDILQIAANPANYNYSWITPNNENYTGNVLQLNGFNSTMEGIYTLIGTDSLGCKDTAFVQIQMFPSIDPFTQDDLDSLLQNSNIYVNIINNDSNVINTNITIISGPFHGSASNQSGVINYVPQQNFYGVDSLQYIACDPICINNCDTAWLRIIVKNLNIDIPQLITPNNDGNNDTWVIDGLNNYPNHSVQILNRWGDVFFKASPYQNNWSGQSNTGMIIGGEKVTSGVYFYVIDLGNGDPVLKGYIVLEN